jgi:TRAP-type C4-dicarboxylate transport system permease large subunit
MGKWLADRPTLRGFLIIALIALVVVVLNLYTALTAIGMLLSIAFFLAIAFFIYLVWRERRDEIASWSARERIVFYGSALLIIAALGLYFWHGWSGYEELGFIAVLACSGFAMWRVWRDRHSYRL